MVSKRKGKSDANVNRLIIASDLINGVKGYINALKSLELLWKCITKHLEFKNNKINWIWIPGDSIWIAAPPDSWKNIKIGNKRIAALNTACNILNTIIRNKKKFLGIKKFTDIRISFSYGRVVLKEIHGRKMYKPKVWFGQSLNLAGRLLDIHEQYDKTNKRMGGILYYESAGFGILGNINLTGKKYLSDLNPFCPIKEKIYYIRKKKIEKEENIFLIKPDEKLNDKDILRDLPSTACATILNRDNLCIQKVICTFKLSTELELIKFFAIYFSKAEYIPEIIKEFIKPIEFDTDVTFKIIKKEQQIFIYTYPCLKTMEGKNLPSNTININEYIKKNKEQVLIMRKDSIGFFFYIKINDANIIISDRCTLNLKILKDYYSESDTNIYQQLISNKIFINF